MASRLRQLATTLSSQRALRNTTIAKAWSSDCRELFASAEGERNSEEDEETNDVVDEEVDDQRIRPAHVNKRTAGEIAAQRQHLTMLQELQHVKMRQPPPAPILRPRAVQERLRFGRHPTNEGLAQAAARIPPIGHSAATLLHTEEPQQHVNEWHQPPSIQPQDDSYMFLAQ